MKRTATATAAARVQAYLARHAKNRQGDPRAIHGYDLGEPSEAELLVADLKLLASPEAPARDVSEWFGVAGAWDETEALAVALFDARCPGIRMTDEDLHYYRAAAQRAMQAVAEELDAPALTPRHEAPASEGEREPLCMAYKTGYAEGVEDSNGMFDRESCEEGWGQYAEKLSAQPALPARLPLPTVDDGCGGRRPINPQDDR